MSERRPRRDWLREMGWAKGEDVVADPIDVPFPEHEHQKMRAKYVASAARCGGNSRALGGPMYTG